MGLQLSSTAFAHALGSIPRTAKTKTKPKMCIKYTKHPNQGSLFRICELETLQQVLALRSRALVPETPD
jgi:hypothetical protein